MLTQSNTRWSGDRAFALKSVLGRKAISTEPADARPGLREMKLSSIDSDLARVRA